MEICQETRDLDNIAGKVSSLLACVNVYRLVSALFPLAPPLDRRAPLLLPEERPHHTVIVRKAQTVTKYIYDADVFFGKFETNFKALKVRDSCDLLWGKARGLSGDWGLENVS